jgi:hypothetical protein
MDDVALRSGPQGRRVVWPDTRGAPSPTTWRRTFDHSPSAPISAAPVTVAPLASRALTVVPSWS